MELLVTRKSLKVVLQGHFSGYPSHKTYTCHYGSHLLQNFGNCIPVYMLPYCWRLQLSCSDHVCLPYRVFEALITTVTDAVPCTHQIPEIGYKHEGNACRDVGRPNSQVAHHSREQLSCEHRHYCIRWGHGELAGHGERYGYPLQAFVTWKRTLHWKKFTVKFISLDVESPLATRLLPTHNVLSFTLSLHDVHRV
jgi:hypothetical protein